MYNRSQSLVTISALGFALIACGSSTDTSFSGGGASGSGGSHLTGGSPAVGGNQAVGGSAGSISSGGASSGGAADGGNAGSGAQGGSAGGGSQVFGSCVEVLRENSGAPSGIYDIDPDGEGEVTPLSVYCDLETAGGGWQLISVVRNDDPDQVIVADGFCTSTDLDTACKGQMHPQQVSAKTEVLVVDGANDHWLIYSGFSGSEDSALRYFSRELELTPSESCHAADHICGDKTRDESLRVERSSGYRVSYSEPLYQWWRYGGWWIGATPDSGQQDGRLHATSYDTAHDLRQRPGELAATELVTAGHQLIFQRTRVGCSNSIQDGNETAPDCGGVCSPCGIGASCSQAADCASAYCSEGTCQHPTSCLARLESQPEAVSGVFAIDVDGNSGGTLPFDVYCDMFTAGGGWQLISVVSGGGQVIVGESYCTDPTAASNGCKGKISPVQVSSTAQILVHAAEDEDWVVYDGFSGSSGSALRYFSRELTLTSSADCDAGDHVCNDNVRDPNLTIAATSGYATVFSGPLYQWWRYGGWWIGANPNAGAGSGATGRLHATSYNGVHDLRGRVAADKPTVLVASGPQRLYVRPQSR